MNNGSVAMLPEASLRYLRRIAEQMMAQSTSEITIRLHEGAVRDYRESRTVRPVDLEESDLALAATLDTTNGAL